MSKGKSSNSTSSFIISLVSVLLILIGGIGFAVYWFFMREKEATKPGNGDPTVSIPCTADADCPSDDLSCQSGECLPKVSQECNVTSDCYPGMGLVCNSKNKMCIYPQNTGGDCTIDADCKKTCNTKTSQCT